MYAFLEDCPLGFENEGLMFEACLVEAEKANLALNMHNALQNISRRKADLKRDSLGLNFNALVSYYESEDSGDGGEKKQGIIKKAWGAIASLFKSIGNFFEKISGKKIPDGSYEADANLPTFLQKAADFASKVHDVINMRNIVSVLGAAASASALLDWIDNTWLKVSGKKTKRYQKKEVEQLLDSARAAEEKYTDLVNRVNEKDIEQGFDKDWDKKRAEAEAEKLHLKERVDDVSSGTIWGLIRKGITTVGNWIKKVTTGLINKIFKKDSKDGEENGSSEENGENKEEKSDGKDNSEGDEKTDDKPDEKPDENSDKKGNNNSSDGNNSSDDSNETEDDKKHEEAGDGSSGSDLFDAIMESLDAVLSAETPGNPVYEEDETDIDDRYNAYRDAEDDLDSGYTPGEFDENDSTFEGYDFGDTSNASYVEGNSADTNPYSEEVDAFDAAFGDYLEDGTGDTGDNGSAEDSVFEGYDLDAVVDHDSNGSTADAEFDEDSSWEAELDALCNELLKD